jgi:hypothetical protein
VYRFERGYGFLSRPDVIGDASGHSEGNPERLSNAPAVIVNNVERGGMGVVFDFLFERID